MKLLITGASGFVGGALWRAARAAGHEVVALGRRPLAEPGYVAWDLTRPLADFVLSTIRTGPNDSCSDGELLLRQLPIKPTYGVLKSRGVFPIGVLQQLEYQRSMP